MLIVLQRMLLSSGQRKTTRKKLTEPLIMTPINISPLDAEWRMGSITGRCFGK